MSVITINKVKKADSAAVCGYCRRVKSSEDMVETLKPLMQDIGAVDFFEITSLDRLEIPVYTIARPRAAWGGTRIHTSAGVTHADAKAASLMSAVERFSAEYRNDPMEFSSYERLGLTRALDPAELILPRQLAIGEELHWVTATDLLSGLGGLGSLDDGNGNDTSSDDAAKIKDAVTDDFTLTDCDEMYIPANAVFHPYDPLGMAQQLFRSDSNGLGAGNTMEEAVYHALCEVIERDALSCAEKNRNLGKKVIIDDSAPQVLRDLLDKFERNGIGINLWSLPSKGAGVTIAAACDDYTTRDPAMLVTGSAYDLSPVSAAVQALIEVAQRRASRLNGEYAEKNADQKLLLERAGYDRLKRINSIWFGSANDNADTCRISDMPDLSTDYVNRDIGIILSSIRDSAEYVFAADITKVMPAVRVVIPGFEVSCVDPSRIKKTNQ